MLPSQEVLDDPLSQKTPDSFSPTPGLYPACVVTRSQSRKDTDISISGSVLMSSFSKEGDVITEDNVFQELVESKEPDPFLKSVSLPLTREHLSSTQQADQTLQSPIQGVPHLSPNGS